MDEDRDVPQIVEKVPPQPEAEDVQFPGRGDVEKRALFHQVAGHGARRRQYRFSRMRD